jgi:hypothetical protein
MLLIGDQRFFGTFMAVGFEQSTLDKLANQILNDSPKPDIGQ